MSNVGDSRGTRPEQLTAALHEAPDNRDHAAVRDYLHRLSNLGLAVLFVYPGTKKPADMRTARQRNADDKAAQSEAREAGRPDWKKARSDSGFALATGDVSTLDRYLDEYVRLFSTFDDNQMTEPAAVNIGIEVGASGLVVIDADTPAEVSAALADGVSDAATVSTPGARNAAGEMVHCDGGHWYFDVPEDIELPTTLGAMKSSPDDGYSVLWNRRYVLVPPSTRKEGIYKAVGAVAELPDWLRGRIVEHGRAHAERAAHSQDRAAHDGPVAAWGSTITWDEILADTDWTNTGKPDSCGCDVWTAPGPHSSPRSATAHGPGCAVFSDSPDPPLHLWTDHGVDPFDCCLESHGGTGNVTRLQAVAAIHYENNLGAAMSALDLHDEPQKLDADQCDDDPTAIGAATGSAVTYPPEFWESRESLRHIRDAALSQRAAPDAALVCVMARLSSRIPPGVRVDTGIMQSLPLNLFAALVSRTGKGKTSAVSGSTVIASFELGWPMDPNDAAKDNDDRSPVRWALGDDFPKEGKVRTGEGIAEMYYGKVQQTNPVTGKPIKARARVRTNALMTTDEGAGLVKHILDSKSTVGETMREAWSGSAIGQSNADEEKYRFVPAGTYALGMIVGFHLTSMADLLTAEQLELDTPQRFLCAWSRPDHRVATAEHMTALIDPGPLRIAVPSVGLRLCDTLRGRIDAEHMNGWLADDDDDADDSIQSQRVAMVARIAALLAVLDGRSETDETDRLIVTEDDWQLAETMYDTSCAITRLAQADRRSRQAKVKSAVRAADLARSIEDDEARATPEGRAAARIVAYLIERGPGPHRWTGKKGIRAKFNSEQTADADAGLAQLVATGRVRRTEGDSGAVFVELVG
ncbi:bifunctional DNA primase/polymerase [Mycolicibacterium hippocampi]|uniref:DNA primase/polymerase bifunctional N-terminal domain-containing protein n=1 Tax=Mycolicibacterium hippocampi TaxID=659824 RepID=A0A850PM57_9MYCO|nr:bifunctional DNA primase/polymerase [Mycolicibacterium hippocampi]NVN51688.1 hypothetical protein [Mycolicibacterium hippocampi]